MPDCCSPMWRVGLAHQVPARSRQHILRGAGRAQADMRRGLCGARGVCLVWVHPMLHGVTMLECITGNLRGWDARTEALAYNKVVARLWEPGKPRSPQ